jgi:hypothetical protein
MDATVIGATVDTVVRRALPGIVSAYLFGSVAEARSHRESDVALGREVDIVIFSDAPGRPRAFPPTHTAYQAGDDRPMTDRFIEIARTPEAAT